MTNVQLNSARKGLIVMALGLACALPVAAQNTPAANTTTTTAPTASATRQDADIRKDDDRSNWGWLGLLGLAGLLGLRRDRDTRTTNSTRAAPAR